MIIATSNLHVEIKRLRTEHIPPGKQDKPCACRDKLGKRRGREAREGRGRGGEGREGGVGGGGGG